MTIEEAVKQGKFENEFHRAAINLLYTSSWLYNINALNLKTHGITPEQYNVLRILRGSHPKKLMLIEITSRMIDKSSNATRLVEKLRQKNLVSREICEDNRRQVDIAITAKGLALLKKIDADTSAWVSTFKNVTQKDAKELNKLLDKLRG
jgi:DNA-binding MarR family transcriptional regulator